MRYRAIWAILVVAASPLAAQGAGERLSSPALPGFVVGHTASNSEQSIREEVPAGQTVQRWTRMVTTQRFSGLARRTTTGDYMQTILAQLPRACPGARTAVANAEANGRSISRMQVDCPRSTGGQPETFIMLAIAGQADIHVKQVAWRGRVTAADLAWGRSFLDRTVLCQPRDRQPACR